MEKEKIIITFSYYGIGGAQRRAINLANEFVEKGYEVTILAVLGADGTIDLNNNYYNIDERINLVLIPEFFESEKSERIYAEYTAKKQNTIRWLKRAQYVLKPIKAINCKINDNIISCNLICTINKEEFINVT